MLAVAVGNFISEVSSPQHDLRGILCPFFMADQLRQECILLEELPVWPSLSQWGKHCALVPGPFAASGNLFRMTPLWQVGPRVQR